VARYKHGPRKTREHAGDIEALKEFVGYDLLDHVERISKVTQTKETLKIAGKLDESGGGGYFTLRVTFNGEPKH
jgi:hypothetical protein